MQLSQNIQEISTPKIPGPVSPVWDDETQSLYFVTPRASGQESTIFRYSFRDGVFYSAYIEGANSASFILPINSMQNCSKKCSKKKNLFAVGVGSQVLIIKWNGKSIRAKVVRGLFSLDSNIPSSRTSLARAGVRGRFYGGTFYYQNCNGPPSLSFYKYDPIYGLKRIFGDLISTSGITFDDNYLQLYHLDSCQALITAFDGSQPEGDLCKFRLSFFFLNFLNFR